MSWMIFGLSFSGLFLTLPAQSGPTVQCQQGINCKLPDCYCGDAGAPGGLNVKDIPQMVVVILDGPIDRTRDILYKRLLPDSLRNPNGCRRSATLFVRGKGTTSGLVENWYRRGIEIALNSERGTDTYDFWHFINRNEMKAEVLVPLNRLLKETKIPRSAIQGYRSPKFAPAGNVQFQVLEYEDFLYDASIRITRQTIFETNIWPSTLDYPWGYRCVEGKCPTNSYPAFWEVPSVSMINGTEAGQHLSNLYATATQFPAQDKKEMYGFLANNFDAFYKHGRAPFLLNLRAEAFLGSYGEEKLQGVYDFLKEVTKKDDVYLVSIRQVIEWMKTPVSLGKVKNFKAWNCPENRGNNQELPKGDPIDLNTLDRSSKIKVLFGRGGGHTLSSSIAALGASIVIALLSLLR